MGPLENIVVARNPSGLALIDFLLAIRVAQTGGGGKRSLDLLLTTGAGACAELDQLFHGLGAGSSMFAFATMASRCPEIATENDWSIGNCPDPSCTFAGIGIKLICGAV